MRIIRHDAAKEERTNAPIFRGEVYRTAAVSENESHEVTVGVVRFAAGGRNVLHTHTHDQILYVTEGEGIVATEQEQHVVRTGDVAVIPAGERHWHGATEHSGMTHLAIVTAGSQTQIVGE
jgi:quercetin dioxygenase-like cupin family protein